METRRHEIGMIGLGVMGRNLLLNMADHGFPVAGYDKDPSKVEALRKESAGNGYTRRRQHPGFHRTAPSAARGHDAGARRPARGFRHRRSVAAPRTGRSHHRRRQLLLQRYQPACPQPDRERHSIPRRGRVRRRGGRAPRPEHHARRTERGVRARPPAASKPSLPRSNGDPCVAYLGPGSAGHFVKMVHNGIEYARDATHGRDIRPDETRSGLERRRTARRVRHVESRESSTAT